MPEPTPNIAQDQERDEMIADLIEQFHAPNSRYVDFFEEAKKLSQPTSNELASQISDLPIEVQISEQSEDTDVTATLESRPVTALANDLGEQFEQHKDFLDTWLERNRNDFLNDLQEAMAVWRKYLGTTDSPDEFDAVIQVDAWLETARELGVASKARHHIVSISPTPQAAGPWWEESLAPYHEWDEMFKSLSTMIYYQQWDKVEAWADELLGTPAQTLLMNEYYAKSGSRSNAVDALQYQHRKCQEMQGDLLIKEVWGISEKNREGSRAVRDRLALVAPMSLSAIPWRQVLQEKNVSSLNDATLVSIEEFQTRLEYLFQELAHTVDAWTATLDQPSFGKPGKSELRGNSGRLSLNNVDSWLSKASKSQSEISMTTLKDLLVGIDETLGQGQVYARVFDAVYLNHRWKDSDLERPKVRM